MQQIFPCPACGAQNVIGQEFCQTFGQRFEYNCPYCGAVVDSALVNCPACRESLYWPTPHKVKPFPRQPAMHQEMDEGGEEVTKPKKKGDPWLIGCLGLVILGLLAFGVYFVYDNFIKKPPPIIPPFPPASENETGLKPMKSPELGCLQNVSTSVFRGDEAPKWL
jgi:hypothetical protein